MNYALLAEYAETETQRQLIDALVEHGSIRKAAKAIGRNTRSVFRTLERIKRNAALHGLSPEHDMTHPVPDGFYAKGVSTYYDEDGKVRGQWVKSQVDKAEQTRILLESIRESFDEFKGRAKPVAPAKAHNADLLQVYPMGDPHIGMYAWAEEAGEDFDVEIASRDLRAAVTNLVERSPAAETAVILNLGDFYHSDNLDNMTRRSGHVLDVDTRWPRVMRAGVDLMIECVQAALKKHKRVVVRNMIGNHDDHSSMFLAVALDKYFHNEPRVTVDLSPSAFWYYQFGKVLIGSTHGDTAKPDKLPAIMASDQAKAWGDTLYRYWYTGHIHSRNVIEFPGVMWESFRTLAAKDAWHAASGYRSGRDMLSLTLHREFGEVGRHAVNVAMVR